MQVAHFLEAATQPWVSAFWAAVQPAKPKHADAAGLSLIPAARPATATLLCDGHPAVVSSQQDLSGKLCRCPAMVHAAAARSCLQHTTAGPQLELNFSSEVQARVWGSTHIELVQSAVAVLRTLQPAPKVVLSVCGGVQDDLPSAFAAAQMYAELAESSAIADLRIQGSMDFMPCRCLTCSTEAATKQSERLGTLLQQISGGLHAVARVWQ
jgi:hypothetical protein